MRRGLTARSSRSGRPTATDVLPLRPYLEQAERWPPSGRHILAHHDETTIVVYQAYRDSTGRHALAHGALGGPDFSFGRMSWIKPNFLWMMYRSSWGTAQGQEVVLGLRLRRSFFDRVLALAVASSHDPERHASRDDWQRALASSEVRLQWDPDHDPCGQKLERRAIQLGLRGSLLRAYATSEILEVIDLNPFLAEQRAHAAREHWSGLRTPEEHVYRPLDVGAAKNVGLDD